MSRRVDVKLEALAKIQFADENLDAQSMSPVKHLQNTRKGDDRQIILNFEIVQKAIRQRTHRSWMRHPAVQLVGI